MEPIDVERAQLDPGSVFAEPEQVLAHPGLDRETKVAILRRWEYDARELQVAEEEGMLGDEGTKLQRIRRALAELGTERPAEHPAPTKQGGD